MKLNEFKIIEEGIIRDLLGGGASYSSKDRFGQTRVPPTMNQQTYVKDFVDDAVIALDSAIKGNLVNINDTTPIGGTSGSGSGTPPALGPGSGTPPASGPGSGQRTQPAVDAYKQQQKTIQNMNDYIKKVSATLNNVTDRNQKIALTKELINYMADRKDYPEWKNAFSTVAQILKRNRAGGNMIMALQTGQRVAEGWQIYWINKLLENISISWNDMGLTLLQESTSKKYVIRETKYLHLDYIFESILEATDSDSEGGMSIATYLKNNFYPNWMKGVDYSDATTMSQIDNIINKIQTSYKKDKGIAGLTQLAHLSYGLGKGNVPAGAKDIVAPGADVELGAKSTSGMNSQQMAAYVKNMMTKLKGVDPDVFSDLLKTLNKI